MPSDQRQPNVTRYCAHHAPGCDDGRKRQREESELRLFHIDETTTGERDDRTANTQDGHRQVPQ